MRFKKGGLPPSKRRRHFHAVSSGFRPFKRRFRGISTPLGICTQVKHHQGVGSETINGGIPCHVNSDVRASSTRNKSRRIPHDLMLNILSRVPARSLVRFRCACKLWNSIFHDPYFFRLQLNHASKNPTTFLGYACDRNCCDQVDFFSFEIEAGKLVVGDKFTVPVEPRGIYRMSNACDGLIAFYGLEYAYVANPSTREWMALPNVSPNRFATYSEETIRAPPEVRAPSLGLGFSAATEKYKLVWMYYNGGGLVRWSCAVLTIGTDCMWRQLGEIIPYRVATTFPPAYSNGFIYWTVHDADFILAFNVSQEEFVKIRVPQCDDPEPYGEGPAYRHFCMSILEGSLCLVDWRVYRDPQRTSYVPFMRIYVLESHSAVDPVWRESHSLALRSVKVVPRSRAIRGPGGGTMVPTFIRDGKLLLFRHCHSWRLHDMVTGACSTVKLPQEELCCVRNRSNPFTSAASIVPIDRSVEQWVM